jgi:hypothetical protein
MLGSNDGETLVATNTLNPCTTLSRHRFKPGPSTPLLAVSRENKPNHPCCIQLCIGRALQVTASAAARSPKPGITTHTPERRQVPDQGRPASRLRTSETTSFVISAGHRILPCNRASPPAAQDEILPFHDASHNRLLISASFHPCNTCSRGGPGLCDELLLDRDLPLLAIDVRVPDINHHHDIHAYSTSESPRSYDNRLLHNRIVRPESLFDFGRGSKLRVIRTSASQDLIRRIPKFLISLCHAFRHHDTRPLQVTKFGPPTLQATRIAACFSHRRHRRGNSPANGRAQPSANIPQERTAQPDHGAHPERAGDHGSA